MLRVQGLEAGYGVVPVLHGVDLQVGDGEAVAVIGANGAGKSALVRALSGLIKVSAGRIEKDGIDITAVPGHRRLRHGIAVVTESRNLFPELTIRDTLRLAEHSGRRAPRKDARFTLAEVHELFPVLTERSRSAVGLLSGGQQQMVAVARALLLQPDLLIMDELTTGLAPVIVRDILAVLNRLRGRGMSILLVEQSIAIASEMTERAYVLSVGKVVHEVPLGGWATMMADKTLIKAYLHG